MADFIIDHPRIKQVRLPFRPPTFQANLYWHRSAHTDPANQWLRHLVAELHAEPERAPPRTR